MIKRIIAAMLCVFCALPLAGCGNGDENEANVIVVMDVSDSMKETDRDKLTRNIANILLYALDGQRFSSFPKAKFGIVTYGREAERTVELTEMKNAEESTIDGIKHSIKGINYEDASGTNYFSGFTEALKMCGEQPAKKNYIYVLSDGQLDMHGKNSDVSADERDKAKETAVSDGTKLAREIISQNSENEYIIRTVGIDTSGDEAQFAALEGIAKDFSGKHRTVTSKLELSKLFGEFVNEFPWSQGVDVQEISGNECVINVDKRYKNVQVTLVGTGDDFGIEKIKSPRGETEITSDETKIKDGTIQIDEKTDSSVVVNIKNPHKGEWVLTINGGDVAGLRFFFNPFPWYIIPAAVVIVALAILLIMWCLKIPPVRYRRKFIPGTISIRKLSDMGEMVICTDEPLSRFKKYLVRGNLTLSSIIGQKGFTDRIMVFKSGDEYSPDSIVIRGGRGVGTIVLYSGEYTDYNIDENNSYEILWKF